MKVSKLLMPTLREVPAEAEIPSHQLMLRAGLMRKAATGVYSYLPLGVKTLQNVEKIIRDVMNEHGAQELLMPAILPKEILEESGRWEVFGPEMFRLKDRNNRDYCLGPTHEEMFTITVRDEVRSYKNLPLTLYQIQTKYRDERRPRFGVMRSREFIMKDAYSFDLNEEGLDESYKNMYDAYCEIFNRMKMDFTIVDADSGAMGGSGSQEFMVKSSVGEDTIAYCENCGYAANDEKMPGVPMECECPEGDLPMEKIHTPNVKTIDDLTSLFKCKSTLFVKTIIYKADNKAVAVMIRGDREINEVKLQNYLGCLELEMADPMTVTEVTGAAVGFAGPVGIKCDLLMDCEVEKMKNFIIGANETDYHYKNVQIGRDFTPTAVLDLIRVKDGDICPKCGGKIATAQGIEVGHIFKLGTKYSKALGCTCLDETGGEKTIIMGCYGIGVNRCIAAIVEQNADENGIVWPVKIAPYKVIVVPVKMDDEVQAKLAEEIYEKFRKMGVDVLMDDRFERPGVKFKDADLIGIPVRITVGKRAEEGIVEYKLRTEKNSVDMAVGDAIKACMDYIEAK
ncbi:MAG: proline--tRNA ligase [Bacillota bacterium]|nr:proline--tRNA ligase [Bacillota bacterium]